MKITRRTGIGCKADCTQERHLFLSTRTFTLTPFAKPCNILNLAV